MGLLLNYPIKYAVLELKRKGGWSENYEDITVGFIASKCYVISQTLRHFADGTSKISNNVVFPYKDICKFETLTLGEIEYSEKESIPEFGWENCTNFDEVTELFDDYESACLNANQKNDELCSKEALHINFSDPNWKFLHRQKLEKVRETLRICKLFEQFVLESTTEMRVEKNHLTLKKI